MRGLLIVLYIGMKLLFHHTPSALQVPDVWPDSQLAGPDMTVCYFFGENNWYWHKSLLFLLIESNR